MATTAVRTPEEYESVLQRYFFERSEEGRAVRVGEKEVSEQAAIVARYADLFSRAQIDALRDAESAADGDERERLYRLRKTCEGGLISASLAEQEDALENAILGARIEFEGEDLPLRSAAARLAVLDSYAGREELADLERAGSARFNDDRLALITAWEESEADITGEPDPIARNEEEKGISLRDLERALVAASDVTTEAGCPCATAGSTGCSVLSAIRSRRTRTWRISAGCRRSSRRTRRSGLSRSVSRACRRSAST